MHVGALWIEVAVNPVLGKQARLLLRDPKAIKHGRIDVSWNGNDSRWLADLSRFHRITVVGGRPPNVAVSVDAGRHRIYAMRWEVVYCG